MRGLVFWTNNKIALLNEKLELSYISDYDEVYTDLALTSVEVVEIDLNEVIRSVNLKSMFRATLYAEDIPCVAEEAIADILKTDPTSLIQLMNDSEK